MTRGAGRREQLYARAGRASVPIEVMIELTQRCNFRCRHCYIPDFTTPNRLTTERALALVEELAGLGTLVLGLSGGEALTRPDWLPVARRARELGFELHVLTNGSLVTTAVARELASLRATVHVSFYSTDERTFDEITRAPGCFRRVVAGVERLRARGVRVILKVPVLTLNAAHLPSVRAWAERVGAECRIATTIFARRDGHPSPLALRVPAHALPAFAGPETGCAGADSAVPDDRPLCAAGTRYAVITANGDVFPCNALPLVAGNVLERSFAEVWRESATFGRLRSLRRADLPVCSTCRWFAACGRCHAEALLEDGDMLGPSSAACARADALGKKLDRSA